MLDQNTDRMWFVIGAVIVGAAIIFIANGTMPELFASVSDSFNDTATKATNVIDEMEVNMSTEGETYSNNSFGWVIGSLNGNHGRGEDYATPKVLRSKYIHLEEGSYEYVSEVLPGASITNTRLWISFYEPNSTSDTHHTVKSWTNEEHIRFDVPEGGWRARFLVQAYEGVWGEGAYRLVNDELLQAVGTEFEVSLNKIGD